MRLILIFLCCASTVFGQPKDTGRRIFTEKAIDSLVTVSSRDSIHFIERLAAYYFHQKLNEYRKSKRLKPLFWNEALWLASQNQAMWLIRNNKFEHVQKAGTPLFTGKTPQDRLNYVTGGSRKYVFSGENILYNSNATGESMEAAAHKIADASFLQWKNSPDHNENMLFKDSYAHGTAFVIADDRLVYAVDLFIYEQAKDLPEPFQPPVFSGASVRKTR